ncbi:uncharacterized protein LOC133518425 [Cydia pomonella]|uniref:uncharacterized protein LOC133518425 n=1 Tax=Cydia pomonella TaxID=82600 RepID=UPI002ADE350D|nr:uncharacterized protein LOC133518425 [Cydia pomonella]
MLEAEVNYERTILDYLNEDCWRAVLQYVPVQDLIRTERASRAWQDMVLAYLQGVRIVIVKEDFSTEKILQNYNSCSLKPSRYKSFLNWTNKLGPSVSSTYCHNLENLGIINENCPNLEALQLSRIVSGPGQLLRHNLNDNFKFLREVSFHWCSIQDDHVNEFIADKALEKLEIRNCTYLYGLCFDSLNLSNLKSLTVECSESLEPVSLLSIMISDREMQSVLCNMPKLECLELNGGYMHGNVSEHLSRLARLKHLSVTYQLQYQHVEVITRCCQELRSLELLDCQCLQGVDAICRHAGARLAALRLDQFSAARDDDVVRLVRGCPRLQSLTIGGAERLTCALPARAAAARREARAGRDPGAGPGSDRPGAGPGSDRPGAGPGSDRPGAGPGSDRPGPLRLDLSYTNLSDEYYLRLQDRGLEHNRQYEEMKTKYDDLIVVLENTMDEYYDEEPFDDEFEANHFHYHDYSFDDYDEVGEEESDHEEE